MRFDGDSGELGVPIRVTTPTRDGLLNDIEQRLLDQCGFSIATLNLDHVVKLRRDGAFRTAYERHSHVVADGNPIVWLNWLSGNSVELITGSDLVLPLMGIAEQLDVPVAFVGSSSEALEAATQRLLEVYPSLSIVARISPSFSLDPSGEEADECIAAVATSGARLCLVALGAPKQELFVARAIRLLENCGFVSVGAGLDFVAGTQRRAPRWVRRIAMEWFWRLSNDWRRLSKRYADCIVILPSLAISALRQRLSVHESGPKVPSAKAKSRSTPNTQSENE